MFDYKLALATGIDIPIPELQTTIHQPSIIEISMIGETDFFVGIQLLCVNKSMYIEDEAMLAQTTNFEIFMTIINEKQLADKKASASQVLTLIFPKAKILFTPRSIVLNFDGVNVIIDEGNFEILQKILQEMFCLSKTDQPNLLIKNKIWGTIATKGGLANGFSQIGNECFAAVCDTGFLEGICGTFRGRS